MSRFSDLSKCNGCGMLIHSRQYHPYAACIMYRQTGQGEKVESFLRTVLLYGMAAERKGVSVDDAMESEIRKE